MTDLPATDPIAPPSATPRALARRLFRTYLAPRWRGLAVALAMAALVALLSGTLVRLLEPAANGIFGQESPHRIWLIPLAIVAAAVLRGIAQAVQATLTNRIGHGIVGDVQVALFARLLRADLAHLNAAHTGAFVSPVLYDANLLREAATSGVVNYTQHALTVVVLIGVMASLDLPLTALVLIAAPVSTAVMRRFAKRTRKAAKGAMQETSALSTAMMEGLDGIKIVKINNREDDETRRVAEVVARRQRHIIKGANARALAAPTTETLMMMVTAAVLAYAGWRAASGGMNGGEFTSFIVALGAASQSLRQLANLQTVMAEGLTAANRLFEALDVEPEVRDTPGAPPLDITDAHLRFEGVSFAYDDGTVAINGASLEVRRGQRVALVGPSGGGKSTLLNLIPRFYDVRTGRVTIDGQDVREVTLASLRDRIALVTQEPFLFDDTIRANIAYGRPNATEAEIEAAARAAAAHDFILDLAQGYDTEVGEAGARLSGGQRQRIAIARAFLKDAPILLLDEATSALDTESEIQVQAALERLMAGRSTLIIAHRLSTVRDCDRIYVVERGEVVEAGDHTALLSRGGLYARMARAQNLDAVDAADTGPVKQLFRAPAVQVLLALLLTGYLKLVLGTIRWRREGEELARAARDSGEGLIVCLWHGRIALSPASWPLGRRLTGPRPRALISLSPDGAFIARTMGWLGIPAIRGSSVKASDPAKPKGGSAAFREALAWIAGGGGLAMTPDGPRGPAERMAAGAVRLAQASGAPVLLVGLACSPAIRLKSWDRTMLPLPFGRGAIVWSGPFNAAPEADIGTLRAEWSRALSEANARAEALAT